MPVTHSKVSSVPDGADTTLVRPSDWNADHTGVPVELTDHLANATDAHDASSISVADAAGDFTATEVEGALAELQSDNEAHVAAADPHTGYVKENDASWTDLTDSGATTLHSHEAVSPAAKYVTTAADGSLSAEVVRQWLANYFPETTPASPDALDDEFDDASFSGWTVTNDPGGADAPEETTFPGHLRVGIPELAVTDNFDAAIRLYRTPPTGTTSFTLEAKLSIAMDAAGNAADGGEFCGVDVYLADSVNDEFVANGLQFNIGSLATPLFTDAAVNGASGTFSAISGRQTLSVHMPGAFYWVRLVKATAAAYTSANTYDCYVSGNGMAWQYTATVSKTFTGACNEVGLIVRKPKAVATTPHGVAIIDYFRKF